MKINVFTFGPFQENTYLLHNDENQFLLVDPGCFHPEEEKELEEAVDKLGGKVQAILQTHCHIDHILGTAFSQETFEAKVYAHEKDLVWYNNAQAAGERYGLPVKAPKPVDVLIKEEETLKFGDLELEVMFIPGHAPGHVVFIHHESKQIIGGDVLFQGSIGRTDLPYCDHDLLISGIKEKLYSLPDDYRVWPGHGPSTLLGEEKKTNPFVRI